MFRGISSFLVFAAFLLFPALGSGADFNISPVRLFFDPGQKTNIIKLKNNSGQKLPFQLSIFTWSQDARGKDKYEPTTDLVVFPKILTLEKDEERIIRIGIRVPTENSEKTYRIYFEQLPQPETSPQEKTKILTLLRIGVPVFIGPGKPEVKGRIESVKMSGGRLYLQLRNSGNTHFIVRKITVEGLDKKGGLVFSADIGSRYLLSGTLSEFALSLPEESCRSAVSIKVAVITDGFTLNERLDVLPEMCSP